MGLGMIYTFHDIIVCALAAVLSTTFEYCYLIKLERRGVSINKAKMIVLYLFVALVVCVLKFIIEFQLAGSELNWNLCATCVIQGLICGFFVSMLWLLYCEGRFRKRRERCGGEKGRYKSRD